MKAVEERAGVDLTNLDQPLGPDAGATKRDLVDYLDAVAHRMLPGLAGRPLTVLRALRGRAPFMQKNVPKYTPDWVRTVPIWAEASKREVHYALCDDRRTLLWLANQRAIEYHPDARPRRQHLPAHAPGARSRPAHRHRLRGRGGRRLPGTSGSRRLRTERRGQDQWVEGVHIFVPVDDSAPVEDVAAATRALAARAEALDPSIATTAFIVEDRAGKVFVDSTRSGGATVAAAYSPRLRSGTPVSFPLAWTDLDRVVPADFTVHSALDALDGRDPWADSMPAPQRLPSELIEFGRTIPVARVAAMHEGKRRARARRDRGE